MKTSPPKHFFLGSILVLFAFTLVQGGCRNIDIMLNEARTTATVTGFAARAIIYKYQVDGRIYTGRGDPGNPPYPRGSTFEIRYSKARPSFSTAQHPLTIFGQFLVGCAFIIAIRYIVKHSSPKAKADTDKPLKL